MLNHPYTPLLMRTERPGRYIGGEFGAAKVPETAHIRMALAFPDAYEIGMSHMGLSILYEIANGMPGMSAERAFMPWPDMEALLREEDLPLVSLESARALCDFDMVGFSLQYELTFTNMLAMLDLGRIPRRACNRKENSPLVIVGGPVAVQAEPIAPFVDLVLLGDGEEALPRLLETQWECKQKNFTRSETVKKLSLIKGVYAPALLKRVKDPISKRTVPIDDRLVHFAAIEKLGNHPTGRGPVPMIQAVFDRFSVEIARGCTEGCRFCQAGFTYRPVRERKESEIGEAVERAVSCLGFDEASLAALSSADHSQIESIVTNLGNRFTDKRVSLSVPSLRAYGLSDELVEVLSRLRATGVTLAPEAGSQRLRDAVNKNVTEEDLMAAAARFFDHGFSRIKLYFMLGLPGETDEDIEEIIYLSVKLRSLGRRRLGRKKVDIVVSVSTFVPKPFTPFEREPMIESDEVKRKQLRLRELGRLHRLDVRMHDNRLSRLEGIFCRGDIELAQVLEKAVDLGARFDGWGEMFNEKAWDEAFENFDTKHLLKEIPDDGKLPWNHIQSPVSEKFRLSERDRARRHETTRPCGRFEAQAKNDAPIFVCHACGLKCKSGDMPIKAQRRKAVPIEEMPLREKPKGFPKPKPVSTSQGEPVKFRIFLSVWGRQTYIGHLDTMRHFMRSLRRAGLEVFYTQGFHPKPKIESPPPLPLGTAGQGEPIDIWLVNPPSDEEIITKINTAVPPDLCVTQLVRLPKDHKKLAKSFTAAKYIALVETSEESAKQAVETILALDSIEVERTRKRQTKTIEIRPYILDASVVQINEDDFRLPRAKGRTAVAMTLAIPGSGGTKPTEVLEPFIPGVADNAWVVRTEWICTKDGS